MWNSLQDALRRRVEELTFKNNMYLDEAFVATSIRNNFAGWYEEDLVRQQIDFIIQTCTVRAQAKVLDAACGHGRHSELLAERGHHVLGTDISPQIISYLTAKGVRGAAFERRALDAIDYSEAFDLIIVLGNSLSLMPRQELPNVLSRLHRALRGKGWLVIELDNREYFIRHEAGRKNWNYYAQRWLVLSEHYYDPDSRLEKTIDTSVDLKNKSVDQFVLTKSLYSFEELAGYFKGARLLIRKRFGDWTGGPIRDDGPSILVAAQKAS